MINARLFAIAVLVILHCASSLDASDLSRYRQFDLNSDLHDVARQAGLDPVAPKVLHQRPAEIHELSWQGNSEDSVNQIVFRFVNSELFSMVVDYDRYNTAGLTEKDVIAAISAIYGPAIDHPPAEVTVLSIYGDDEPVKIIARWEDASWSFNLVRFKYETSFALVALSKRLHTVARAAIAEAIRLDRQEAPQRATDRQNEEEEKKRLKQEQSRQANRPGFRP